MTSLLEHLASNFSSSSSSSFSSPNIPPPRRQKKKKSALPAGGVLSRLRSRAQAAGELETLIRSHSPDGDGYIHSVEWMDLVRNTFETPEKELDDAQIAVLFRRLDRHNTGFLSLSQLMKFFSVGAAAEPFDEEKAAEPAEPSGGEFNRASAADFSRRPSMRKRTSIHELRKDLEALDSTDEVGPPPAAPDAAPADDKEYLDGEENWRQAVYKKERDAAYELASMAAQLREFETAIAQTSKANDVLHRAIRNRDAMREEEQRRAEEAEKMRMLKVSAGMTPDEATTTFRRRGSWKGSFKFQMDVDHAIDEMAKTAKREAAAEAMALARACT
jgi:hypothetical protein